MSHQISRFEGWWVDDVRTFLISNNSNIAHDHCLLGQWSITRHARVEIKRCDNRISWGVQRVKSPRRYYLRWVVAAATMLVWASLAIPSGRRNGDEQSIRLASTRARTFVPSLIDELLMTTIRRNLDESVIRDGLRERRWVKWTLWHVTCRSENDKNICLPMTHRSSIRVWKKENFTFHWM